MDDPRPEGVWIAEPPTSTDHDLIGRHRALQLISLAMIGAGIAIPIATLAGTPELLNQPRNPESVQRLIGTLLLLGLGGLLLVCG